jgi:hypothetical protein
MVRITKIQNTDEEGLEHLQLDDYYINDDDYFSNTPSPNTKQLTASTVASYLIAHLTSWMLSG